MDLDASLKSLQTFKARLERLLDGGLLDRLEAAAGAGAGEELGKRIEEVGEHVAALEQRFDELAPKLAAVEKLADPAVLDMLDWLAGRREALDVVLSLGETADGIPANAGGGPGPALSGPNGEGNPNSGTPVPASPETEQAPS